MINLAADKTLTTTQRFPTPGLHSNAAWPTVNASPPARNSKNRGSTVRQAVEPEP